ncbi:hypothetical protein MRB53_042115 [Persea americana]|nr:hypothetical protein MRB53_042115 [Persea americana]
MSRTSRPRSHGFHYAVLGLPDPTSRANVTPEQIRAAARRQLLVFHPDKATLDSSLNNAPSEPVLTRPTMTPTSSTPTVDDILLARETLLDPKRRAEYDRGLMSTYATAASQRSAVESSFAAMELVDLFDLAWSPTKQAWRRACRCGSATAFVVTEDDLEEASREGAQEVVVGCEGCSLGIRVAFDLAEGDAH